jgi:exodeoxyribonuclease V alpha subunit
MTSSGATETIRGTIERVSYRNPENGYAVLQVMLEGSRDKITVVGLAPHAAAGTYAIITGEYREHPKFGRQFALHNLTDTPPSSSYDIERYLSSGLIAGIGKKTAERLVQEFGTTALDVIKDDPDAVAAIPGIGKKKAELLSTALTNQSSFDQTLRFLVEHRISPHLSYKIYERFKHNTLETIQKDPYILAREIRGIGFQTADAIAMNLGTGPLSPQRLQAGVYAALSDASDDGHCCLPKHILLQKAQLLLGIEEIEEITTTIQSLLDQDILVSYRDGIFIKSVALAEDAVASWIANRSTRSGLLRIGDAAIQDAIKEAEQILGMTLSPEQHKAVEIAAKEPFMIITGGPGCGKTTVIKAITQLFERVGISFAMAAPTGKAAQRMSQVCAVPASTIHRLLKYDPVSNGFVFNARNPLPYEAIIVDEASMIDLLLAQDLLAAIPDKCTLILVGDKDQLPSVGAGRVFGDLVSCYGVRVVQLSKLYRRSDSSNITTVAHMINMGELPTIPMPDGQTKSDAYFILRENAEDAGKLLESLVAEQIPRKFGFSGSEIVVLTPTNRGPLGTRELNKRLQERLNPQASHPADKILEIGDSNYRIGDRVCQRVNNYKIDPNGVYNGDMGTIVDVDTDVQRLTVELWDGRLVQYPRGEISQLSLAYALTVHRSQGMEAPCVVFALDTSHFTLLERQLVYTGVTRAKKLLIIVGSQRALGIAAKRAQTKKRCTYLTERIRQILNNEEPTWED